MDNKTLIYSPRVEAYVMTKGDKVIDLSKDIIGGSVRRITNGVSTASLTLNNKDRRYTGKLERMDRIYIRAYKGSQEYGLFMGYLTTVPVFDAYPVNAVIEAQCTLKQIMHTYWDPTSPEAVEKFIVEQYPIRQTVIPYNPLNPVPGEPGEVRIVGTEDQQRLVSEAMSWLGKLNYGHGRGNPVLSGEADCSSFLSFVYKKVFGMNIGGWSYEQAESGAQIMSGGSSISNIDISKLQPGDIIAYNWQGARWRKTWDHVAMYVGNGQRIDHGFGRGPKLFPVDKVYQPMVKWTVRRHISPGFNLDTPGGSLNAGINVGFDPHLGEAMEPDYVWDDREEYFKQQVADGMGGIRIKGFLNEVCGWPYDRILIEPLPKKLADMVTSFEINEGASDPEEMIQQVYRTIMGDTFANSQEQSESVIDPNGFTGSEGQGNATYTRVMYGIAKVISNLNYTTQTVLYIPGGSGAYGLTAKHFHGTEAHTRPKASQDAKMLSVLRGFVNSGTNNTVVDLAEAYFDSVELPKMNNTGSITWSTGGNRTLALEVRKQGANAPVPANSISDRLGLTQGPTGFDVSQGATELDLYLKGLRETESNNNYTATNSFSTASGAYQYIDGTWANYGGKKRAKDALPEVQDRRAREDAIRDYNRFKDWEMVAANHFYPLWADKKHLWNQSPGFGNNTVRVYVDRVLRYMGGATGGAGVDNPLQGNVGQGDLMDMSMYAFFKQVNFNNNQVSEASAMLTGEKALMNDQSAIEFVKTLVKGSMREFQSDREGNFMAFYPDHFGMYSDNPQDGIVPIQDVEIKNFTIRATDTVYTHVYTLDHSKYPDLLWRGTGSIPEIQMQLDTNGVITFENEDIIRTILGWDPKRVRDFLQRFGGRPHTERALEITNKTFSKMFTIATFLERWAGQYNTSVDFTFMPELWPGNRASIGNTNVAVYVDSVTHNFSYSSGFTTSATISSPQSIGPNDYDLPKGAF